MSFYLDSEDQDVPLAANEGYDIPKTDISSATFVCENCNGVHSYEDETSGALVCAECFTQSQTTIAASQEVIDYDDTMVMAGRIGGRLKSKNAPSAQNLRKRARVEDSDQTASLPDTESCIIGMQRVLRETVLIVANILCCGEMCTCRVLDTAKTVWKGFLCSWAEGARYYTRIYPEIRFSFRDGFLNQLSRTMVLKTLAHKASKKARNESQTMWSSDRISNKNKHGPDVPCLVQSGFESEEQLNDFRHRDFVPGIRTLGLERMVTLHQERGQEDSCGRIAIAMTLSPSPILVASILCIAFTPYGITCSTIRNWIKDGRLPLRDSFHLLSPREQNLLIAAKGVFLMAELPSVRLLEKNVSKLRVASGCKPRYCLVRKKEPKRNLRDLLISPSVANSFTVRSLPLVLGRMVSQIGLSQQVLNFSLALLGLPLLTNHDNLPTTAFPEPRRAYRCDRVVDSGTSSLLSVIIVACMIISQRENHWFCPPFCTEDLPISMLGRNWYFSFLLECETRLMVVDDLSIFDDSVDSTRTGRQSLADSVLAYRVGLRDRLSSRKRKRKSMRSDLSHKLSKRHCHNRDMVVTPPPLGALVDHLSLNSGANARELSRMIFDKSTP